MKFSLSFMQDWETFQIITNFFQIFNGARTITNEPQKE